MIRTTAIRHWRRGTVLAIVVLLAVAGCSDESGERPADLLSDASSSSPSSPASPAAPPDEGPASIASTTLPDDWQATALAAADRARRSVVAIGWEPPRIVNRRLETGWLISPDLVVTSNVVACDAQRGVDLSVRTFDGAIRDATIEAIINGCDAAARGAALLRLREPVADPPLTLRTVGPPAIGEPLMAIGHANFAPVFGGWLVAVGPVVTSDPDVTWADIGVSVDWQRIDEFFGGGANGAPLVDLDGNVAALLCCERNWAPPITHDSPVAEARLRERLVIDAPFFVGGLTADALRTAFEDIVGPLEP